MPTGSFQQVMSGTTTTSTNVAHVVGSVVRGLRKYDWFTIDANLKGVLAGTLDVYVQRLVSDASQVTGGVWADWIHFPQLAEGAARVYYTANSQPLTSITAVGRGTDASPGTPALAANTSIGGHPGDQVRMVAKASTVSNTGTSLSITVTGWQGRD